MSTKYKKIRKFEPIPFPENFDLSDQESLQYSKIFYEKMKKRHTVRDFSSKPVPREIIENCIKTAGLAPNGANKQPWHFSVLGQGVKRKIIRKEAEIEEQNFYGGKAGQEWLKSLRPFGTDTNKPFLEEAPWLIVVFSQRYKKNEDGTKLKNYYVPESCGIACGFLITAIHNAGLVCLTHTPSPMRFLNEICGRPENEKALMIVVVGHPSVDAKIPKEALRKSPLNEIASFL